MRKYFQITFFLASFGALVLLKQLRGGDEIKVVQKPALNNLLTPTISPIPTSSLPNTTPFPTQVPTMMMQPMMGQYKNGAYTGKVADAFYGNIQVQAVIQNGKIVDVIFLQYPNDNRTSISINSQADPMLRQEAIQAQSANVDIISGASASSQAFQESLTDALSQAK